MHRLACLAAVALVAACSSNAAPDGMSPDAHVMIIDGPIGPGPDSGPIGDVDGGGTCGTCPGGTTCGTANGIPVCKTASGVPVFDHIVIVLMENTSWSTLQSSTNTPYLHGLMTTDAVAGDYHGVAHPSLPNYIAMISGDTAAIKCDCDPTGGACNGLNCNTLIHTCGCPVAAQSLGDQLEAANVTWKAYAEDMGTPCNMTSSGGYATRHVPFVYFDGLQQNAALCAQHVVDYTNLAADLDALPRFVFVAPNLTNDMHDPFPAGAQNLANGDTWLSTEMPKILTSASFTTHSLLVIVWDEDDLSGGLTGTDDPVPMFVISPLAKHGGFTSMVKADHYALLATIEDSLGLPRLGAAAQAQPLLDFFPAQ
jgi:hypothetical protein